MNDTTASDPGPGTGQPPTLVDHAAAAFTAYQAGERAQMGELVDLLTPLLWHTARGAGLSGAAAEDVVQTAWLRLVENADRITTPRAVVSWLLTTVRRESWRTAKAGTREDGDLDFIPEPVSRDPDPAVSTVLRERERVLWRHLAQLGERCQHLLRVIAFADKPDYASIAQTLGMPVGSIGPTRGRCLANLRQSLRKDPDWDGGWA